MYVCCFLYPKENEANECINYKVFISACVDAAPAFISSVTLSKVDFLGLVLQESLCDSL